MRFACLRRKREGSLYRSPLAVMVQPFARSCWQANAMDATLAGRHANNAASCAESWPPRARRIDRRTGKVADLALRPRKRFEQFTKAARCYGLS
jgi:hypothetical protein